MLPMQGMGLTPLLLVIAARICLVMSNESI
jgi:hypothetical protein